MTEEAPSKVCPHCKHSLQDNNHGLDQNDLEMEEEGTVRYVGSCIYCRVCNPQIFEKTKN